MLNESDWKSLSAEMQTIELKQSEILFHPATPIQKVYFPINCLVSLITVFEDGASAEMATVGFEGAVDIRAVLGSGLTTTEHIVQVPGLALATDSDSFQKSRVDLMSFNDALQQYVQAFTTHVLQSVACNAVHSVRSRAAKWLLLCQDRNGTDTFPITQQ
ncbi:MAG: Crp/Fnr family transcriptional regulator, partial [Rhodospirillales bacterium]|nr:Crp/Fnr family transcriptional regulator [Acetobacter sp.]